MLFKEKCNELGDWGQRVLREYNEEINELEQNGYI